MTLSSSIDRDQLRARCLDDQEFMRQMLAVFRQFAPQTLAQLKASLLAGVASDAKRHAHTLQGSAANLAADDLRQATRVVEQALNANEPAMVEAAMASLTRAMERCLGEVDRLLEQFSHG